MSHSEDLRLTCAFSAAPTDAMTSGTFNGPHCRTLRERRIGRQTDLAALLGVSQYTINRWENGRSQPSSKHFTALCAALRVEADDLLIQT